MRSIIYLTIFFAMMQMTSAAIFSGWIENNQTVTIDGTDYHTTTDEGVVILKEINGTTKIVLVVEGKKQIGDLVFEHVEEDKIETDIIDDIKVHAKETNLWKHKITVTKLSQTITSTRRIVPAEPFVFDTVNIEWEMKNTGSEKVLGIVYKEHIPIFLTPVRYKIKETDNERSMQNMYDVNWKFNLNPGETITLVGEFDIIAKSGSMELEEGTLTYTTIENPISTKIDAQDFPIRYPLEITYANTLSGIRYTGDFETTFNFNNEHPAELLDISKIRIDFPASVIVKQAPKGYEKTGTNSYVLKGQKIEAAGSLQHDFRLKSDFFDSNQVNISVDYIYKNSNFELEDTKNLTASFKKPSMDMIFTGRSGTTIRGGDILDIEFSLQNNEPYDIEEALVRITSDLFESRNFIYRHLKSNTDISKGIIRKKFSVRLPTIDEAKAENINMTVIFKSMTNDTIRYFYSETLKVAEGISDMIYDITGTILNLSNDIYTIEIDVKKLTKDSVENLFLDIETEGEKHTINISADDLSKINNKIASIIVPAKVKADITSNFTKMSVTLRSLVDGREITEQREYYLNGTEFFTKEEAEELSVTEANKTKETKTTAEQIKTPPPKQGEFTIAANSLKDSNLMYFIFGLIGILAVVGIWFFIDYIKSGRKSGNVDYDEGFSGGLRDISDTFTQSGTGMESMSVLEDPELEEDDKYKPLIGSGKRKSGFKGL